MTMKKTALIIATTLVAFASPAHADHFDPADETVEGSEVMQSADGTRKWSFLITYGEESCPEPEGNEIVVCAERPESERYRIPSTIYEKPELPHTGAQSLAAATETLDGFSRLSRPNSCSVVGTGGWTGCTAAALREWFAERREDGVE